MHIQAVSELTNIDFIINKSEDFPTSGAPIIPTALDNDSYIELSYKKDGKYDSVNIKFDKLLEWINTNIGYLNTKLHNLEVKHDKDVEDLLELIKDYKEELDNAISQLRTDHNNDKEALEKDYNDKINALRSDHDKDKQQLQDDYNYKINLLKAVHKNDKEALEAAISQLRADHNNDKYELNTRIDNIIREMTSKYVKLSINDNQTITGPITFSTKVIGTITNADLANQAKWS